MSYINEEAINYLEYNSQREHLIIPEYGRYVQKLIDQITQLKIEKSAIKVLDM